MTAGAASEYVEDDFELETAEDGGGPDCSAAE